MSTHIPPEKMTAEIVREMHDKMLRMFAAFTDADFTFMVAYRLKNHELQPHCVLSDVEELDYVLRSLSNDDEVKVIELHVFNQQGVTGGHLIYSETQTEIKCPDNEVGRAADTIITSVYPEILKRKKIIGPDA